MVRESDNSIVVEGLVRVFKKGPRAVDGIDLHVDPGEIYGFLGPNGAGKSTTVLVLTTLLPPTAGRATVAGFDVVKQGPQVRKAIGARKSDIRLQFLIEAVFLTLTGGTLGILIGAAIAFLVRTTIPSVPATLSALWISIGFAISVGVGLFFGYYPANVAANLDPIVSLRYE